LVHHQHFGFFDCGHGGAARFSGQQGDLAEEFACPDGANKSSTSLASVSGNLYLPVFNDIERFAGFSLVADNFTRGKELSFVTPGQVTELLAIQYLQELNLFEPLDTIVQRVRRHGFTMVINLTDRVRNFNLVTSEAIPHGLEHVGLNYVVTSKILNPKFHG